MAMTRTLTGRTVIYTDVDVIDRNNVVEVLNKALETHDVNKNDIQYLYDYYKGKQPILERVKDIRPEINNKLVENRFSMFAVVEAMSIPKLSISSMSLCSPRIRRRRTKSLPIGLPFAVLLSVWYSRMPLTMMLTKLLSRFILSTLAIPLWFITMVSATNARWA